MLSYSLIYDDASFDSIYHILCKFIFITIETIKILIFARYFPSNRRHQTAPYLYHKNSNILIYNINQLGIRSYFRIYKKRYAKILVIRGNKNVIRGDKKRGHLSVSSSL